MPKAAATTWGLTHLDMAVHDPDRALAFYAAVFGLKARSCVKDDLDPGAQTPGSHDLIAFKRAPERAGQVGGIAHIGFFAPATPLMSNSSCSAPGSRRWNDPLARRARTGSPVGAAA